MAEKRIPLTTPVRVFYSWESDLPNNVNRSLIENALKRAFDNLGKNKWIEEAPRLDLDKDTQGVPGAPPIDRTILSKIEVSDIFVGDVSIVTGFEANERTGKRRPSPNPNVMFELGYAMRALSEARIIMVGNTAFGLKQDLPFDIEQRRVIFYEALPDATDLGETRKYLIGRLTSALKDIVADVMQKRSVEAEPKVAPEDAVIAAIDTQSPRVELIVRKYMEEQTAAIRDLMPNCLDQQAATSLQAFVSNVTCTHQLTNGVLRVAEYAITTRDAYGLRAAKAMYRSFGRLFDLFQAPRNISGIYYPTAFDLPEFVAREWLIGLFALLLREERWDIIPVLLDERIEVCNDLNHLRSFQDYTYARHYMALIEQFANEHKLIYSTAFGWFLKQRYESVDNPVVGGPTFEQMVDADYFLYFATQMRMSDPDVSGTRPKLFPVCSVYLSSVPAFLDAVRHKSLVPQLFSALKVTSVEEMRERYAHNVLSLTELYGRPVMNDPRAAIQPHQIGDRP